MKKLIIIILSLSATISLAEKQDFSELIQENAKEQKEIHQNLTDKEGWSEKETQKEVAAPTRLESTVVEYTPKTHKSLLTYKKEKVDHRPSYKKQLKRVAKEINELQGEF